MLKLTKLLLVFMLAIYVTGCTFMTSKYDVSVDNISHMKEFGTIKIALSDFTSSKPGASSITCRGVSKVSTPNKEPFEKYIKNAFKSELQRAGLYSEYSPINLSVHFTKIDFSSNFGAGKWFFEVTASSSKSDSVNIISKYEFPTSWVADKACQQVAQSFSPAVKKLIKDIITDLMFERLIRGYSEDTTPKI